MTNFEINKFVNNLKFEVRKLFNDELKINEVNFSLIDKYTPEKIRTINFDNSKNSTIYKLKTNFVKDKLNLMQEIIYDSNINGFYSFNNFFIRDSLLTKNSFPIIETLDICLKIRTTEIFDDTNIINKLASCLEVITKSTNNFKENSPIKISPFKEINDTNIFIIKFDDFFSKQKYIMKDSKIEEMMSFYNFLLIKDWKPSTSKYFNDWYEDINQQTLKILYTDKSEIFDLGFINIFEEINLINIVLNWNNILQIIFPNITLEKIMNIPESLIKIKEK